MPHESSHDIRPISSADALRFYRQFHLKGEQVSYSPSGKWFAYYLHDDLIGIVSALRIGKSTRIKTLMVRKGFRQRGIGTALLNHLIYPGIKYTAFATHYSRPLFKKFGFEEVSMKANNISYMVKGAE